MTPRTVRSSNPAGGTTGSAWVIVNLLVGIRYGWWQLEHNRLMRSNKVGADPDVALAAIAMTPERARGFVAG
jgi:hypothetical protein